MAATRMPSAVRVVAGALVVAVALAGMALTGCAADPQPQTVEIVVPAGTQDRLAAGEEVVVMPARLELRVGDTLFIRNEDDVVQSVGPYSVQPGGEMQLTYGAPGTYEGYCPLSEGERYQIVVEG
jgi:plastocyanin